MELLSGALVVCGIFIIYVVVVRNRKEFLKLNAESYNALLDEINGLRMEIETLDSRMDELKLDYASNYNLTTIVASVCGLLSERINLLAKALNLEYVPESKNEKVEPAKYVKVKESVSV